MKKTAVVFVAFVVWLAVNLCCGRLLGGINWDITNNKQYSLDVVSKEIARTVKQPIVFRLYVSDNLSAYNKDQYDYVAKVTNLLGQYQKLNPKNIKLEIVKVKPYSDEAKLAEEVGIKPLPFNDEYVYAGVQVLNNEKQKIISELVSGRETYFENDINRIILSMDETEQPIVGIASLDMPIFENTEKKKVWSLLDELSENYRLMRVTEDTVYIPQDVKVLMLLNPKGLPVTFLYALDQYLMYGGKVIVFIDPYSEAEQFYKGYPPHPQTNIQSLLNQWGIVYDYQKVIGSFAEALQIDDEIRYPLWFFVDDGEKHKLHFRSAGTLEVIPNSGDDIKYEILLKSPSDSGVIDAEGLRYVPKKSVAENFKSENHSYNLAIKAVGSFLSGYSHSLYDGTKYIDDFPPFAPVASDKATLVVIADSDFVSDDAWVLESDEKNRIYGSVPYADNSEYIMSLIHDLLPEGAKNGAVSSPKKQNKKSIAEALSEPMLAVYTQVQSGLKTKYNLMQEQLREKKVWVKIADGTQKLELRKEIDGLNNSLQNVLEEIKRSSNDFGNSLKQKVNFLLWLNAVICPALILALVVVWSKWKRKVNLRRF